MSKTYQLNQDLKEYVAMVDGLEVYVRGTQLYGQTGGGFFSRMPSLTVGAVLMRRRRLDEFYHDFNDKQRQQLDKARQQHDETAYEWKMHYGEKATKEANSRLDAMRTFFREVTDNPKQAPSIYSPESLRRTIVQELVTYMTDNWLMDDDMEKKIRGTDNQLRGLVTPVDFIWSDTLKPIYPSDVYWWLYQSPPIIQK